MKLDAGGFLRQALETEGHDAAWLAERTGMEPAALGTLLAHANLDAALFVRLGEAIRPDFLFLLDNLIFANNSNCCH